MSAGDHFAGFVLAAVEQMDLSEFDAPYRLDGHGRPEWRLITATHNLLKLHRQTIAPA